MKTKRQILRILLTSGISKQRIKTKDFSGLSFKLDLSYCDFSEFNFSYSNFSNSDFRSSNFSYSNFSNSDFSYSNFSNSNFSNSDFSYSNFSYSKFMGFFINESTFGLTINCPEEGSFIGYKKAQNLIVVIEIQEDAKRSSATTYKCRASKIKVLRIENLDGTLSELTEIESSYTINLPEDQKVIYRINEIIEIKDFDTDRRNECSNGVHFFINRKMAVCY